MSDSPAFAFCRVLFVLLFPVPQLYAQTPSSQPTSRPTTSHLHRHLTTSRPSARPVHRTPTTRSCNMACRLQQLMSSCQRPSSSCTKLVKGILRERASWKQGRAWLLTRSENEQQAVLKIFSWKQTLSFSWIRYLVASGDRSLRGEIAFRLRPHCKGRADVRRLLGELLLDKRRDVSREAIATLAMCGDVALKALRHGLDARDPLVRILTVRRLARAPQKAFMSLLRASLHTDSQVRWAARQALRLQHATLLPSWMQRLTSADVSARRLVAQVLMTEGIRVSSLVYKMLSDRDLTVRLYALRWAGRQTTLSQRWMRALHGSLLASDVSIRKQAFVCLFRLLSTHQARQALLLQAVQDRDKALRLRALKWSSALSVSSLPILRVALFDREADVRWKAFAQLQTLGREAYDEVLLSLLHTDGRIRREARRKLNEWRLSDKERTRRLLRLFRQGSAKVSASAFLLLKRMGQRAKSAEKLLRKMLKDVQGAKRKRTYILLRAMQPPKTSPRKRKR